MRFAISYNIDEFKRYYRTLKDLRDYFKTLGLQEVNEDLGVAEEAHIKRDPAHLIVWIENNEIIGHAIWHETSTDEHQKGDPRDVEDREILRRLLGGRKANIVELHEVWLKAVYRGRGCGKEFFEFFEEFIRNRGFGAIVYYTDNPAAISICRNRGYAEDFLKKKNWHVFCLNYLERGF